MAPGGSRSAKPKVRDRGAVSAKTSRARAGSDQARSPAAVEAAPPVALGDDEAEIGAIVEALRTDEGKERALASIVLRVRRGYLTRDEVSALTLEKHCVLGVGRLRKENELREQLADAEARMAELQKAMAGGRGGSMRADSAVVPPMTEDLEVGADMAGATRPPRDREPYQS